MTSQLRLGALHFLVMSASLSSIVPAANIPRLGFLFKDDDEGARIMDGPVGGYIQDEIEAKGLHALRTVWDIGMIQTATNTRAIRSPDDLRGLKLSIPSSPILIDLFKAFGASPVVLDTAERYTALQTHIVDGVAFPFSAIESLGLIDVIKFVAIMNASWSPLWVIANAATFKGLPSELQAIVERNNSKYALLERRDVKLLNASLEEKLGRRGLTLNRVDQTPFRARLGSYYDTWSRAFGPSAWSMLQHSLGRQT